MEKLNGSSELDAVYSEITAALEALELRIEALEESNLENET